MSDVQENCPRCDRMKASTASAHARYHKQEARASDARAFAERWRAAAKARLQIINELKHSLFYARREVDSLRGVDPRFTALAEACGLVCDECRNGVAVELIDEDYMHPCADGTHKTFCEATGIREVLARHAKPTHDPIDWRARAKALEAVARAAEALADAQPSTRAYLDALDSVRVAVASARSSGAIGGLANPSAKPFDTSRAVSKPQPPHKGRR